MSHERMFKSERQLEGEMRALLRKAEIIDTQEDGQHRGLLRALELLLEGLDLPLVLRAELLQLLLLFQGQNLLLIGILGCLPPTLHLLRVSAPFPVIGAELRDIEPCGLQHRELVGSTPSLWFLLGSRHHLSL